MADKKSARLDSIRRYNDLIAKQAGRAVRPYREDGFINMVTKYGTQRDSSERYEFIPEPEYPDELMISFYEGNGLFAKIIDTPAEEAIKHSFILDDVTDQNLVDFYEEALDELDWEETAMTAIKWARLFGGSIAVMLINDGRGLEEPLDWRNIKSIDDIRVYGRDLIQPDYTSMFTYDPQDPFRTRGSRLGMPEFYQVSSKYGFFTVHESRCLTFQNGILPENTRSTNYQLWGIPEYVRIHKAVQDAEVAHRSAPKILERSIQPVYSMKNLAQELATEQGEAMVLKRLQAIDLARGVMNSMVIDAEGENYDFRTFQYTGINDVLAASCNLLSAVTNIPQTILFGQPVGGLSTTDDTAMENYYNYIERIQKRMVRSNLRYLLSVIFQAGVATGEVDEVPKLKVKFNPLWSVSDMEQADLDLKKAQLQQTKAATAATYVDMQAIDPTEVRKKLADSDEFDVEQMLDEYEDDELFPEEEEGSENEFVSEADIDPHNTDPGKEGSASTAAPAATKLPQDMTEEELQKAAKRAPRGDEAEGIPTPPPYAKVASVGVLAVKDGKILTGTRAEGSGTGLIGGPGGHIEPGETPEEAAIRETEEEFGIIPGELTFLGYGEPEPETGLTPAVFLCTEWDGDIEPLDGEMADAKFRSVQELQRLQPSLFAPFADGVRVLSRALSGERMDAGDEDWITVNGTHILLNSEGKAQSGGKLKGKDLSGAKSQKGGSKPSAANDRIRASYKAGNYIEVDRAIRKELKEAPVGTIITLPNGRTFGKSDNDEFYEEVDRFGRVPASANSVANATDKFDIENAPNFKYPDGKVETNPEPVKNQPSPDSSSEYEGKLEFEFGSPPSKEAMTQTLQELRKNQKSGEAPYSSKDLEYAVGNLIAYGQGDECVKMLLTQSPNSYGEEVKSLFHMTDSERSEYSKRAESIEHFLSLSDKYEKPVYRGLSFLNDSPESESEIGQLIDKLKPGQVIDMGHISSWAKNRGTADEYASSAADFGAEEGIESYSVLYRLEKPKSVVDIGKIKPAEGEALSPKTMKLQVTGVKHEYDEDMLNHRYIVEVEEI